MWKHDASRTDPCGGGAIEAEDRIQYRQYSGWVGEVETDVATAGESGITVTGGVTAQPFAKALVET